MKLELRTISSMRSSWHLKPSPASALFLLTLSFTRALSLDFDILLRRCAVRLPESIAGSTSNSTPHGGVQAIDVVYNKYPGFTDAVAFGLLFTIAVCVTYMGRRPLLRGWYLGYACGVTMYNRKFVYVRFLAQSDVVSQELYALLRF